jgi:hypothetical protein
VASRELRVSFLGSVEVQRSPLKKEQSLPRSVVERTFPDDGLIIPMDETGAQMCHVSRLVDRLTCIRLGIALVSLGLERGSSLRYTERLEKLC